jgi:hypothetical protein
MAGRSLVGTGLTDNDQASDLPHVPAQLFNHTASLIKGPIEQPPDVGWRLVAETSVSRGRGVCHGPQPLYYIMCADWQRRSRARVSRATDQA